MFNTASRPSKGNPCATAQTSSAAGRSGARGSSCGALPQLRCEVREADVGKMQGLIPAPEQPKLLVGEGNVMVREGTPQVAHCEGKTPLGNEREDVTQGAEDVSPRQRRQLLPTLLELLGGTCGHIQEAMYVKLYRIWNSMFLPMDNTIALHHMALELRVAQRALHVWATCRVCVTLHADTTTRTRLRASMEVQLRHRIMIGPRVGHDVELLRLHRENENAHGTHGEMSWNRRVVPRGPQLKLVHERTEASERRCRSKVLSESPQLGVSDKALAKPV
mmetsp:Transcript_15834/g.43190  ORF Transcript_15834/g.43190 Transcript_15834/m.43190 type:complete len:277 (-) Transcript_15834:455-1285(-)